MEELEELKNRLEQQRPAPWEALPDLNLYMDQVIGYMPRQLIRYGEEEWLTSAMVNNYIKDGLLPRAEGKRYSRTHLAYLTAICALKQALAATAGRLDPALGEEELPALALELALRSYADKLACQRVLDLIRRRQPEPTKKSKKERKEEK